MTSIEAIQATAPAALALGRGGALAGGLGARGHLDAGRAVELDVVPLQEALAGLHDEHALAAAVAMPDPVFGERVCVYVELREGEAALSLDQLIAFLRGRDVSK